MNGEITKVYKRVLYGDWVVCGCCGEQMLLPYGADKCPECDKEGDLRWVEPFDESKQEIALADLSSIEFIDRELKEEDCFYD